MPRYVSPVPTGALKTAATKAATTTADYAGKKAGDKIVELLSGKRTKTPKSIPSVKKIEHTMTPQEVNDRVNQIISGGKLRRRIFI